MASYRRKVSKSGEYIGDVYIGTMESSYIAYVRPLHGKSLPAIALLL